MRWFFRGFSASEKRQGGEGGGTSRPGVSFRWYLGEGISLMRFCGPASSAKADIFNDETAVHGTRIFEGRKEAA